MEINKVWSEHLISYLLSLGVEKFCIAPGGQSTPLVSALDAHGINPTVHFDERGIGFYALGWSKLKGFPAVVITTSGTAVANLMPAVMEAAHAKEPLIIITADLSWEHTDSGFNQSCDQSKIFSAYTNWNFDFPAPLENFNPQALNSILKQAVVSALGAPAGPVHLNVRFRSPIFQPQSAAKAIETKKQKIEATKLLPTENILEELREELNQAKAGVVVLGQMPCWLDKKLLSEFLKQLRWPVFADILSGFRGEEGFCSHFPIYLTDTRTREALKPDCVLHLGGDIVLRPPAEPFLRGVHQYLNQPGIKRIVVNENISRQDPFNNVDRQVVASLDLFAKYLLKAGLKQSILYAPFLELEAKAAQAIVEIEFGEVAALSQILSQIDKSSTLFVGNSLPLREVDYLLTEKISNVVSAHGLKGIDGIIAMAAGVQNASNKKLTLILGDISFLYDINSLALLKNASVNLVVLNNDGGQIFSYVDCKNTNSFQRNFLNPHGMNFEYVAKQFDIDYFKAEDLTSLNKALESISEAEHSTVLEVKSENLHQQQITLFSNTLKRII